MSAADAHHAPPVPVFQALCAHLLGRRSACRTSSRSFQTGHLVDAGDLSVPQTLSSAARSSWTDARPARSRSSSARTSTASHARLRTVGGVPAVRITWPRVWSLRRRGRRVALPSGIAWDFLVGGLTVLTSATGAALAVAGFERAALALGRRRRQRSCGRRSGRHDRPVAVRRRSIPKRGRPPRSCGRALLVSAAARGGGRIRKVVAASLLLPSAASRMTSLSSRRNSSLRRSAIDRSRSPCA